MKIAIIGFGIEGRAALDYWRDGNEITICDKNADLALPEGVTGQLGEDYLTGLDGFDLVVRSPFVRPDAIVTANSVDIIPKITSNTNEFMRVSPSRNIIGITGTKGKGTTSTLVTKLLEAAGHRVHLGGNIGVAALDLLKNDIQPTDWVVLELSSYQLIDLKDSPTITACLMVAPEHLDWHTSLEEYLAAKQQLFRWQSPEDTAVFYPDNTYSTTITEITVAERVPYMRTPGAYVQDTTITIDDQAICEVADLRLIGTHNWQNVCAALTIVWRITQDVAALRRALTEFKGLPFRLELRREVHDIRYFDDSFAAAPGASVAAMSAIQGPKVMILGGFDRGLELEELAIGALEHNQDIRQAILIGASRQRLADALTARGFTNFTLSDATKMTEIVSQASSYAQPGDAVVLSPGFASFDMFKNFEDRGRQFNDAVEAL